MSFKLSEIQQLIQQNTRDFAKEYIKSNIRKTDSDDTYFLKVVRKLAENDFWGLYLPEKYGGSEAGYLSFILAVEELAKVNAGIAAVLVNHASIASYALNRWGSAAQKKRYLEPMCRGEKLGAFALTEPGAAPGEGPNKVIAVKHDNSYILNGRKSYVANGGVAGTYIVFAVTDLRKGSNGLSAFIVDAETPGISVVRSIMKMGMRACPSAELLFQNVCVSADDMLGLEGEGVAIVKETKAVAGVAEGSLVIGIAQAAMADAAYYAKQRVQFGQPIANFPAIQNMLAEMAANIHFARLAIYDAADSIEKGEKVITKAAMIKLLVSRIGTNALVDVVQIFGGYGYSEDIIASHYYRDVKGMFMIDGSTDFPEQIIAAELLA